MSSNKPSITDFIATDTDAAFLNLRTGEGHTVDDMLKMFSWSEVLQIPFGHQPVPKQRRQPAEQQE